MRLRHLDLNLLVALEALLSLRSVTAAANQLHVTQPSMSGSLARLRVSQYVIKSPLRFAPSNVPVPTMATTLARTNATPVSHGGSFHRILKSVD